ncbi:ubiquitin-conjugating enzyme E2 2-like protein, partial [Tanacetum coccineum]
SPLSDLFVAQDDGGDRADDICDKMDDDNDGSETKSSSRKNLDLNCLGLMSEFERLKNNLPAGISAAPENNSIMAWNAVISSPDGTPGDGGVTKGLNLLKNSSANKKYDGMPIGYTSQPTNEELIDFVILLTNGKDIYPDRVGRVDLFDRHPAAIIRDSIHSGHLLPPVHRLVKSFPSNNRSQLEIFGYGFLAFSLSSLGELEKDAMALLKRIRKFSVT